MSDEYFDEFMAERKLRHDAEARIAQLEAALTKVHGIVAEYWAPCMASIETLATIRDAIGDEAINWKPCLPAQNEPKP
jgi:hypothetical protein